VLDPQKRHEALRPLSKTHRTLSLYVPPALMPYILESNPHLVLGDFLNGKKKLVWDSNPHLSFNRPLPTGRLFESCRMLPMR